MTLTHAELHHTPARDSTPACVRARRAGWALGGLGAAFLAFDACFKLLATTEAATATAALGWDPSALVPLGILQLVCLALYLVPRTAVFGALLWTGYLGGAVATHVRVGSPLFSHILFPVYVATFLWLGLWLRDRQLRSLLPFRA